MKLPSKVSVLTTCTALLFCLTSPVLAQPTTAKTDARPKPAADAPKDSDPWKRRLPELQFDNLPLSEVASFLSDQFPEINFVLHPSVKDIPILLKLRSVTLDDIFTALDIATPGTGPAIDPTTGLPVGGGVVQIKKLNDRMVSFTYQQTFASEVAKPVCRAFTLANYLAGKSDTEAGNALKEVEDALSRCWRMLEAADRSSTKTETPQLSLHRATKLLIVVGQPHQVDVVAQVVTQLEQGNLTRIDPATGLPVDSPAAQMLRQRYGGDITSPSTPKPPGSK